MTLEEKARESAESKGFGLGCTVSQTDCYVQGYINGAKENGTQWHDLRKDPNDLPKEYDTVLVCTEDIDLHKLVLICNYHYDKWWFADGETAEDVIAWCEIPQFKE